MHFWIDKRSSQLHQYGGGGRRGAGGAGGFYSQNFGTHRSSHHPPPQSYSQHYRIRSRSSSTNAPSSSSNANNNVVSTNSNNNNGNSVNATSNAATIALQYPHQQPHQVTQQHVLIPPGAGYSGLGSSNNVAGNVSRLPGTGLAMCNSDAFKNITTSTYFSHPSQQQPILGGGILSISGVTAGASGGATSINSSVAIVGGEDGQSGASTVLTLPPASSLNVNPSTSINLQLISCVNINPDNRGGLDHSWRNPYHVPGSSISRCRAYSRDVPPILTAGATSSRGTRGRRTSNSSSSGLGRSSIPTGMSPHSQTATVETPEGMTDRSTRSERTSIDRDTINTTPQHSLSLTSPEAGEQSSRATSGRPSIENDPSWACTKRVGLTLCFLAFILLGTVGVKFMVQGPGVIDTGKAETAAYFLFTELIFVAFAMALFFTGVACLRKRTNDYLLRQFNQYILNTSATPVPAGAPNGIAGQDAYDFEYYDGANPTASMGGGAGSPNRGHGHHHHHHHHGFHPYRHNRSDHSLIEVVDFGADLASPPNFHGAGPIHYPAHYGNGVNNGSNSRHSRSKPPPYHIALYLPLPEGMGGTSPIDENSNGNAEEDPGKNKFIDGISYIDSSSVKDEQDGVDGTITLNNSSENRDSTQRNGGGSGQDNRSETPPPPYEQL